MSFSNLIGSTSAPENRRADRAPSELKTIVQIKEGEDVTWKEVTKVATVSRNGAGFCLSRPCIMGRLISLVMPLNPDLRAYDEKEEVYPVMGIVQYCNEGLINGERVFHVGVGFIGKQIPESFKADPKQSYRIIGMTKAGLWEITEAESEFKNRKQPRYWFALGVTITLLQKAGKSTSKEETVTKNVGTGGASVACSLDAAVGDKLKFACKELDFYAIAVVRNRKIEKGSEVPTLHLQFVDAEFPIDRVIAARTSPSSSR
ncbi:MAG: hypothetical protein ABIO36_01340 [Pyrinomonadaceae bacterium]